MAAKAEKIVSDPEVGEVVFRKSTRCRRISIRVHPLRGVTVSIPYMVPYAAAMAFFAFSILLRALFRFLRIVSI